MFEDYLGLKPGTTGNIAAAICPEEVWQSVTTCRSEELLTGALSAQILDPAGNAVSVNPSRDDLMKYCCGSMSYGNNYKKSAIRQLVGLFVATLIVVLDESAAAAQDRNPRIVFDSREYQLVGQSTVETWEIRPPDGRKAKFAGTDRSQCSVVQKVTGLNAKVAGKGKLPAASSDFQKIAYVDSDSTHLQIVQAGDGNPIKSISLPARSARWNYPTSVAWSPDGKLLLVGAEAGTSDSQFEDYWLLDWNSEKWQWAGGGNEAKWSPDSSKILWSTPRDLAPLGRIRVWVVHLVLFDVASLKQQLLTSGVTYESDFTWCGTAMAEVRDAFQEAGPLSRDDIRSFWMPSTARVEAIGALKNVPTSFPHSYSAVYRNCRRSLAPIPTEVIKPIPPMGPG